jgi:hypothetical protein
MEWRSRQGKNYLHLASERGLGTSLQLLLEAAREQGWLLQLTQAADITGFLPGWVLLSPKTMNIPF